MSHQQKQQQFGGNEDNEEDIRSTGGSEWSMNTKIALLEAKNKILEGKVENLELKAQIQALTEEANFNKLKEENKAIRTRMEAAEEKANKLEANIQEIQKKMEDSSQEMAIQHEKQLRGQKRKAEDDYSACHSAQQPAQHSVQQKSSFAQKSAQTPTISTLVVLHMPNATMTKLNQSWAYPQLHAYTTELLKEMLTIERRTSADEIDQLVRVEYVMPQIPPQPRNERDTTLFVRLINAQNAQRIAQALKNGFQAEFNFRGENIKPRCFMARTETELIYPRSH